MTLCAGRRRVPLQAEADGLRTQTGLRQARECAVRKYKSRCRALCADMVNNMTISEKSAYLKGLADGLDYDRDSAVGKLIAALIDLTGELATAVDEIDTAIDEIDSDLEELNDYIEEVVEDLGDVEEFIFDIDDDDDGEYDDEYDDDCTDCEGCDGCGGADDDDFRMMMCPHCNEEIYFDESLDPSELVCPACGKPVCDDEPEELD